MKKIFSLLFVMTFLIFPIFTFAKGGGRGGHGGSVSVRGYTRRDGTYVRPYTRSAPRSRSGGGSSLDLYWDEERQPQELKVWREKVNDHTLMHLESEPINENSSDTQTSTFDLYRQDEEKQTQELKATTKKVGDRTVLVIESVPKTTNGGKGQ